MKTSTRFLSGRILPLLAALAALFATLPVRATLLTPSYEAQLEAWLGEGDLTLTNVFTKVAGDGQLSTAFHAAADGKGATFTLMSVTAGSLAGTQIIGGYNPQSWFSSPTFSGSLNYVPGGDAFIYNLTDGRVQHQNASYWGAYQTYNFQYWGPAFGAGNDFYADTSLTNGLAFTFSYGTDGRSIVNGGDAYKHYEYYTIADIEVYTFAPATGAAVPEAANTLGLLSVALAGFAGLRRRLAAC